jgi:hypothetical protein
LGTVASCSGEITSANLERKEYRLSDPDAAAVKAVENAQPFPAPPAEVDDSQLKFTYSFIFRKMGDDEWSRKVRAATFMHLHGL